MKNILKSAVIVILIVFTTINFIYCGCCKKKGKNGGDGGNKSSKIKSKNDDNPKDEEKPISLKPVKKIIKDKGGKNITVNFVNNPTDTYLDSIDPRYFEIKEVVEKINEYKTALAKEAGINSNIEKLKKRVDLKKFTDFFEKLVTGLSKYVEYREVYAESNWELFKQLFFISTNDLPNININIDPNNFILGNDTVSKFNMYVKFDGSSSYGSKYCNGCKSSKEYNKKEFFKFDKKDMDVINNILSNNSSLSTALSSYNTIEDNAVKAKNEGLIGYYYKTTIDNEALRVSSNTIIQIYDPRSAAADLLKHPIEMVYIDLEYSYRTQFLSGVNKFFEDRSNEYDDYSKIPENIRNEIETHNVVDKAKELIEFYNEKCKILAELDEICNNEIKKGDQIKKLEADLINVRGEKEMAQISIRSAIKMFNINNK